MTTPTRWRIPIRFKIVVTVLTLISTVVGLITFTMANLFHKDKAAYIHDLTSVIAMHTAEEARSVLVSQLERLLVFGRILRDPGLEAQQKTVLIKELFEDFQDFVAVTLYEGNEERTSLYDTATLERSGLTTEDLQTHRNQFPLPLEQIARGSPYAANATLKETLPLLVLATAASDGGETAPAVLAAWLRLDGLRRLTGRSRVFESFIFDKRGTVLAHKDPSLVVRRAAVDWLPELKPLEDGKSLVATAEYGPAGSEMVGGFARVDLGGLLAGVQVPKTAAYLTARQLLDNLVGAALALLTGAAVLSLLWSYRLTRPIERLSQATRVVGKGQFDIQVEARSRDEIGELASSFNQMAVELHNRDQALQQAQEALVQSEKMAAFGQLSAGIAHEVKNPLAGILGYAQLSLRKLNQEDPVYRNLSLIEKETKRCKTIIENLMKFARQEKVVKEPTDLNRVVGDAIAIVDHQLTINRVRIETEFAPGSLEFLGNGNQIQQVVMNFLINAQQAMEGKPGLVRVTTQQRGEGWLELRVSDTGPGIPREIQAKIFEPFFTTKPAGKGTGLGLAVTYGIVKDHRGELRVESVPGQGATFIVALPAAEPGEAAPPAGSRPVPGGTKSLGMSSRFSG